MSLLLESIKVIYNSLQNPDYHNNRVNQSRNELLGIHETWDLRQMITLPSLDFNTVYKCRFIYERDLVSTEFHPYTMKPLKALKVVECPDLMYRYKYLDRSRLDALKSAHPEADDVLIVQDNHITDCSYANIVFYDGTKWITPATPLLQGTKRQLYIDNHIIAESEITLSDLKLFTKARIINAMIDLNQCPDIAIDNIIT